MSWEAWFTLVVVVAILTVLVRDLISPAAAVFGGMVAVLVAGIVTPAEALSGFANPAPFTVAALYVLARSVEKTGALSLIVGATLGNGSGGRTSLARLVGPTAVASAFLNNTPIVAMLSPQVSAWAEGRNRSPSLYLMPLSFAAILGGVVTVIGTSTNVVVSGLLLESGQEAMGFFEITKVGLPVAAAGVILLVLLSPVMLPARRSIRREVAEESRRFTIDMQVEVGGPLDGKQVEAAGLRHLKGVFLAAVEREGDLQTVAPDTVLRGGDRLRFVGRADDVVDLHTIRGLHSAERSQLVELNHSEARYFEVVIGSASPLIGRTMKEIGFRERYQAVVLAIHRAGQLVDAKLGEVPLRVGDTMILLADRGFRGRWRDRNDFLLVSPMGGMPPVAKTKAALVGLVTLGIVITAAAGLLPILQASLLGVVALLVTGVVSPSEARNAIDLEVIVVIASAFGLAAALETSGLAQTVASGLVEAFGGWGDAGVLLGVVLATVVLTEMITNNAAALLMFPIALSAAQATAIAPRGFALAVAVAASASFLTPIGYQTNTMVYGPGGYRFTDYTRLGLPLTLVTVVITLVLVPLVWPL